MKVEKQVRLGFKRVAEQESNEKSINLGNAARALGGSLGGSCLQFAIMLWGLPIAWGLSSLEDSEYPPVE